jgi:ABC-type molybdate transport system substrate-binding protein
MRRILALVTALAISLPALAQHAPKATEPTNLTILADDTMLLPIARIARGYTKKTKTPITVVALNAAEAEHQIEQGIEAHLVITANAPLLERLSTQGLTDVSSRRVLARTQLALVTSGDLNKKVELAERISFASVLAATPTLPIFLNAPTTIEGGLAKKLSTEGEFATILAPRISEKPNREDIIASLHDEPSLALILATDAVAEPDIRVLSLLPETISAPVTFESVVLGSETMVQSRAFSSYLMGKEAQKILADFGYQPPTRGLAPAP